MKLSAVLAGCCGMLATAAAAVPPETVVLLHGMGRSQASMWRLEWELEREGYRVLNLTYPSRTQPLEVLANEWLPQRLARLAPASRVHFVTHSMGGILVRLWRRESLEHGRDDSRLRLGRVVMLAPPNAGSEIPDRLGAFPPFHWITGINGRRLGTSAGALPRALGPWPASQSGGGTLGIIAGAWSVPVGTAAWLPRPNDGKVSVASTHLAGERDHVVVPFSHSWIGWRRETIAQVKAFLASGEFDRAAAARPR